jgi:hypothetical protein
MISGPDAGAQLSPVTTASLLLVERESGRRILLARAPSSDGKSGSLARNQQRGRVLPLSFLGLAPIPHQGSERGKLEARSGSADRCSVFPRVSSGAESRQGRVSGGPLFALPPPVRRPGPAAPGGNMVSRAKHRRDHERAFQSAVQLRGPSLDGSWTCAACGRQRNPADSASCPRCAAPRQKVKL